MAKVSSMVGAALSATTLKAFFEGSDATKVAEKVAQAEGSRMQYLFGMFPQSDVSTVRAAVKGYKELAEKEGGAKSPQHKTAGVRGSEIQTLYGAWRFGEFKPDGMGYHAAVGAARATLKGAGIRWTGDKIPEKWERDVRKQVEQEAQVELATRMDEERAKQKGEELTPEQVEALREKHAEESQKADMVALGRGLLKKYGAEKCGWLVDILESQIAAAEQSARDKAAERKAA